MHFTHPLKECQMSTENEEMDLVSMFGEPIYSYTREQAIDDGVLVDISATAAEAGIKWPVACTTKVWSDYIVPDERSRPQGQSESGRLWDLVWMLGWAIRRGEVRDSYGIFSAYFIMKERQRRLIKFKTVVGPGDNGEPVITVMMPDED